MSAPQRLFMLCPAGTPAAASSRLRCHGLARELARLGCRVQLGLDTTVVPSLLYVQKRVTPEILGHAKRVRAEGGRVVFDIDDWGSALDWVKADPALFAEFLSLTDAVSVDTEVRADVFRKDPVYAAVPQFWVIPDPIDYIDAVAAELPARRFDERPLQGCWFGNAPNANPAVPYMQAALQSGRVGRFSVITNADYVPRLQQAWPMLGVEAWQLETFPARLREHDFCLLIHDTTIEGVQKSNNKMLAALGQGVMPLVSNTPAYAELAQHIGVPDLVLDAPADLPARLQPGRLQAMRDAIQAEPCRRALRDFMPATVAARFLDKAMQLLHEAPKRHPVRLNLGSGGVPLAGYVNVDVAQQRAGRQPDVVCDIRDLKVFPDGMADEVLAVHVIEHFYRWEVADLLKEWVRVLKPGGKLVLETPNLITACEELLKNPDTASAPDARGQRTMWCLYGDPLHRDPLMCHRWLYTPQSLAQIMHEAGLRQLEQTPPRYKLGHPRDMRVEGVKPAP